MAIERRWLAIPPRQFTADGTSQGLIMLENTRDLRVKMRIVLKSSAKTDIPVQIKRVAKTFIIVGPVPLPNTQKAINERIDITGFLVADGAFLYAEEQDKSMLKPDDADQATYEQEPVVARRVISVDENGNFYNNDNPVPTIQGGSQIAPPEFDEVVIVRDSDDYPTQYQFFLKGAQVWAIDVEYNSNKFSVHYKGNKI